MIGVEMARRCKPFAERLAPSDPDPVEQIAAWPNLFREMAVRIEDVRDLTAGLPRSYEVLVRGRIKFRVGRIVYLAFSRDETLMGFAFPKEEREAALETYPDRYLRPEPSDMRYQWLVVRLDAIDKDELRELVFDAWRMVVPKKLASLSDDELWQQGVA